MKITLADVIARRRELSPREAATITLAVGREWDRRRTRYGPIPFPAPSTIELTENGTLTFPPPPLDQPDSVTGTPLPALFAQLLGLGEDEAPRRDIPRRLLITIASRPDSMTAPAVIDQGFRTALFRFADTDPRALALLFWRLTGTRRVSADESSDVVRAYVHRGPERRREPPAVAELRRAIRQLERRAFETRAIGRRTDAPGPRYARTRPVGLMWPVISVCTAILIGIAAFVAGAGTVGQEPTRQQVATSDTRVQPAGVPAAGGVATPRAARPGSRPAAKVSVSRQLSPNPSRSRPPRTPAHVTFAGGTRTIAWMRSVD